MPQMKSIMNLRGEQGTLLVTDITVHEGSWACFVVLEDCVLDNVNMPKEDGNNLDYAGILFPQGFVFYGPITQIQLVSGKVQMHNFIDPSRARAINH